MERFGALFLRVLTLSAGCSAVLVPLLLCARRLRQKIAARSFYVLFLLLALRLVLPVEIKLPVPAVELPAPDLTVSVPVAPVPRPTVRPDLDLPVVQAPVQAAPRPVKQVPVLHILGVAWAAGVLLCALFSAGSYLLARRRLLGGSEAATEGDRALLDCLRQELGVKRPVSLCRSGAASGPLALGLFHPVIVLPGNGKPAEELVLRHELTHIRRRDVAYKLVLSLACWVNWFNPFVWLMDRAARRNLELCCDDEVIRDLPDQERRHYGNLLLDAAAVRSIPFSTCFSGGKNLMKERLSNLFTHKRNSTALVGLVLVVALLAGSMVACGGVGEQLSAESAALMEFPGAHWNDTPEAVLKALKITQEQISGDETYDEGSVRTITADNIACFGGTAGIVLRFMQEEDAPMGLFRVELRFSDDTDMNAVKEELTTLYGESSQEKPMKYRIQDNEVVNDSVQSDGIMTLMTVNWPGQEPFTYRDEPNEHTLYWSANGKGLLPEKFDESKCAAIFKQRNDPASAEVVSQWLEQEPLVQLTWTDAYVLVDGSLKTNNRVTFCGDAYTWLVQMCSSSATGAGAEPTPPGSGAPYIPEEHEVTPENQARRDLYELYFAQQHYENARASVVLADLTGDGLEEMLLLTVSTQDDAVAELSRVTAENFAYGEWKVFGVQDGAVVEYPAVSSVSSSHAGWGYVYLVPRTDGNGFAILDFRPATGQGLAAYSYGVNVLDEKTGAWYALEGGDVLFHLIPEDADSATLIMGEDVWTDSSSEEVEQLLSRVQAYRDYGVPLLVYNEAYGGTTGGPEFEVLWMVPSGAFDGTGGVYKTEDDAAFGGGADSDVPVGFPLPNPPATPEEALELLNASAQAADGTFMFRIPNYDGDWNVQIAGRMRMGGEESDDYMSVHYLEGEEWVPGKRYCIDTNGAYFDDLTLTATVTCHDGSHAEHSICLEGTDDHALVHHDESEFHHEEPHVNVSVTPIQTPDPDQVQAMIQGAHHPETNHSSGHHS